MCHLSWCISGLKHFSAVEEIYSPAAFMNLEQKANHFFLLQWMKKLFIIIKTSRVHLEWTSTVYTMHYQYYSFQANSFQANSFIYIFIFCNYFIFWSRLCGCQADKLDYPVLLLTYFVGERKPENLEGSYTDTEITY